MGGGGERTDTVLCAAVARVLTSLEADDADEQAAAVAAARALLPLSPVMQQSVFQLVVGETGASKNSALIALLEFAAPSPTSAQKVSAIASHGSYDRDGGCSSLTNACCSLLCRRGTTVEFCTTTSRTSDRRSAVCVR